jgi:hypothetical protein
VRPSGRINDTAVLDPSCPVNQCPMPIPHEYDVLLTPCVSMGPFTPGHGMRRSSRPPKPKAKPKRRPASIHPGVANRCRGGSGQTLQRGAPRVRQESPQDRNGCSCIRRSATYWRGSEVGLPSPPIVGIGLLIQRAAIASRIARSNPASWNSICVQTEFTRQSYSV